MDWLPSTKTRYLLLASGLLIGLALLDAIARSVHVLQGAGFAVLLWSCFGAALGWLLLEPLVQTAMVVGKLQPEEPMVEKVKKIAEEVCALGKRKAPDICVYESNAMAATTVGLGFRSKVFVSRYVAELPADQLRAIFAHEVGHIALHHGVARLALYSALLALAMLSSGVPLAPMLANLFVLWCTRQMEFKADQVAASLVGSDPVKAVLQRSLVEFGDVPAWQNVFNTHPPFSERIRRLPS